MYIVNSDQVTQTVAPASEPLTLTEAKAHLRISFTDEDTYVTSLIQAAREWAEAYTGRCFVERTYRADIPTFAEVIKLPHHPIIAVDSIAYYDTDSPSAQQTLASSVYRVYTDCIVRGYGQTWPTVDPRPAAISITYRAGYASTSSPQSLAENVPMALKHAMKICIADWYEVRETSVIGLVRSENPAAQRLLHAYRVYQ